MIAPLIGRLLRRLRPVEADGSVPDAIRSGAVFRFRRSRDGATAVEFGLIAMPFFMLLFAIIETGMIFFTSGVVDKAVYNAGRQIMVGAVARTPGPPAAKLTKFKTDLCNQLSWFVDCNDIVLDVQSFKTYGDVDPSIPVRNGDLDMASLPRFNPGQAGEIVLVRAYYPVKVYTSFLDGLPNLNGNRRLIMGVYSFKNEPFGKTGTGV
ncbi:MAG TPA: pilus assembly protein [Beijerinckiaceae bacterium]|nr:pilus assembly protein [Beijerinckiaceae bacterium]